MPEAPLSLHWRALEIKYSEAAFFAWQLRAHERFPKLFLFYLSAFVSSARAITWHLQKQAADPSQADLYRYLQMELLSDDVCEFFVAARNEMEKRGYPKLQFLYVTGKGSTWSDPLTWTAHAGGSLGFDSNSPGFKFIDDLLQQEWDFTHQFRGDNDYYESQVQWRFPEFSKGR